MKLTCSQVDILFAQTKIEQGCVRVQGVERKSRMHERGNGKNCTFKEAYTSGPFFEKIMKRYPIISLQINYYQIDKRHK